MGILAWDVGHSATKVAIFNNGKRRKYAYCNAGKESALFKIISGWPRPDVNVLASVDARSKKILKKIGDCRVVSATDVPMKTNYSSSKIGVDRLLACLAAKCIYGTHLAVADFGSGTTIDYVCGRGIHRGGIIAPGIESMFNALGNVDKKLSAPVRLSKFKIPLDTKAAISAGVMLSAAGLVEKFIASHDKKITLIVTGGLGKEIFPHINYKNKIFSDNLVLRGLALL